jgi:hypothetical protein
MKKAFLLLLTCMCWASLSSAGLLYNYAQLLPMDLDEMNALVKKKMKEFKKENSTQILMEAVQAVYSRPNAEDPMVDKVMPPLRSELEENDLWEPVMDSLVKEAIGALNNPKAFKPVVLNTYAVFLENVIADFQPFAEKPGYERKVIQKIQDANIKITKEEENERKLRGLANHKSPSEIARTSLETAKKAEVENDKAQAAAKLAETSSAKDEKPKVEKKKK